MVPLAISLSITASIGSLFHGEDVYVSFDVYLLKTCNLISKTVCGSQLASLSSVLHNEDSDSRTRIWLNSCLAEMWTWIKNVIHKTFKNRYFDV